MREASWTSRRTNPMPDPFDPAPFRRAALLEALLLRLQGGDPDADLPADERALRAEVRRLLITRHNALQGVSPAEQDVLILRCVAQARRTLRRKARRAASGRTWA